MALALVMVLALGGCGASSGGSSTAAGGTSGVTHQFRGKHQSRECVLAAKEIARTELEHVKEVVSVESSEAKEFDMRIRERESTALSHCNSHR